MISSKEMNTEDIILCEIHQAQDNESCLRLLICGVQNTSMCISSKKKDNCLWLEGGVYGERDADQRAERRRPGERKLSR